MCPKWRDCHAKTQHRQASLGGMLDCLVQCHASRNLPHVAKMLRLPATNSLMCPKWHACHAKTKQLKHSTVRSPWAACWTAWYRATLAEACPHVAKMLRLPAKSSLMCPKWHACHAKQSTFRRPWAACWIPWDRLESYMAKVSRLPAETCPM